MKKTLVALAVAAFASSASALTIYDNDGTKVDFNGRVKVAFVNSESDNERTDLVNDGSRFSFKATHQITEELKGLSYLEVRFEDSAKKESSTFGNPTLKRLYAGLEAKNIGTLTFGRQLTNGDPLGLSDFTNLYGGINQVIGSGNKVVKFTSAEFAGFKFGADYLFGTRDRNVKSDGPKGEYRSAYDLGVFYKNAFTDAFTFKANVGFSRSKYDMNNRKSDERTAWTAAVGAELFSKLNLGVTYTEARDTSKQDWLINYFDKGRGAKAFNISKYRAVEVGAEYQVLPELAVYGAYQFHKGYKQKKPVVGANSAKGHAFIAGVGYNVHKNVRTFVEFGTERVKYSDGTSAKRDNKAGVGFGIYW